ncbi:class F sortase [Streptomyces sp. RB6PN25]|uniref:Class F sortase n=1 Tax=Streptomyces humicola TaxID=2953240 RepID=A0ABT1PZL5_9ACTN|nr:class F sortase [Streptomyces humicola]MCQ4083104.1 class F sortase [Streptomyces humicola]
MDMLRPKRSWYGQFAVPGAIAAAAAAGIFLIHDGMETSGPPQPAGAAAVNPADTAAAPGAHAPAAASLPFSTPVRIRIPAIGVYARIMKVGLAEGGWVGVPPPDDTGLTGWYSGSAAPGETGTAVIDGHVDTMRGPSVFYELGALHKGDRIDVTRADGRTAVFTVYGINVFPQDDFPARRVYGGTGRAELRVITCGGVFTRRTGYQGNVVVFARLTRTR